MGAHLDPHPSVVKRFREYNPRVQIRYNDKWEQLGDVDYRYIVGQPVLRAVPISGGMIAMVEDFIGLFHVPQAQEFDERWLYHLHDCKVDREKKKPSWMEQRIARQQQGIKEMHQSIDDHADELWAGFQNSMHDIRLPQTQARDPYTDQKRFEDKHGRPMI